MHRAAALTAHLFPPINPNYRHSDAPQVKLPGVPVFTYTKVEHPLDECPVVTVEGSRYYIRTRPVTRNDGIFDFLLTLLCSGDDDAALYDLELKCSNSFPFLLPLSHLLCSAVQGST